MSRHPFDNVFAIDIAAWCDRDGYCWHCGHLADNHSLCCDCNPHDWSEETWQAIERKATA